MMIKEGEKISIDEKKNWIGCYQIENGIRILELREKKIGLVVGIDFDKKKKMVIPKLNNPNIE